MADTKLSDLSALTSVATGDLFYVVDISDTTDDAAGSSKKITRANLITSFANTFTFGQTIAQTAGTGTQISALTVTGAAHTALTASTENIGVNLDMSATKQFAAGAITTQREVVVLGATYSFVSGSNTISDAATLYVKEPTAGTNATITRKAAITAEGTVTVRQPGGTAGTDEVAVYHDGTRAHVRSYDGDLKLYNGTVNGSSILMSEAEGTVRGGFGLASWLAGTAPDNCVVLVGAGSAYILMGSNIYFGWTNTSNNPTATADVSFYRIAAGVLGAGSGAASGLGWIQNSAGVAILGSNFTSTGTTLANTNLSRTVIAGRSYAFRVFLPVNNATAGDGFKCNFNGGTCTATVFFAATHTTGTATPGNDVSSALATDLTTASATSTSFVEITGTLVVSSGGTFIMKAAKNSDAAGATMTLLAGAWMRLDDMVSV